MKRTHTPGVGFTRPGTLGPVLRATDLCLVVAVLGGCDAKGRSNASDPVDGMALTRAALLDGSSCYARHPRLCIDDPAFIDAAIESALEKRFKGVMPTQRRDVDRVIASARTAYRTSMQSPVGLERLEEHVKAVYQDPSIDADAVPGVVNADFGALPGELSLGGRVKDIRLRDSPLLEGHNWSGTEIAARMGAVVQAHPEANVVRGELRIPRGSRKRMVYRYFAKRRQLVFGERGKRTVRVCEPLADGAALTKSALDLGDCRACAPSPSAGSNRWCPVDDPYLAVQRKAEREAQKAAR